MRANILIHPCMCKRMNACHTMHVCAAKYASRPTKTSIVMPDSTFSTPMEQPQTRRHRMNGLFSHLLPCSCLSGAACEIRLAGGAISLCLCLSVRLPGLLLSFCLCLIVSLCISASVCRSVT